ncbi:MAG: hypothetical protein MUQ10_11085, partial [Anaerolineae bacterium]|nr:hypothetical protein [Anaerolineae bacterium]
MSKNTRKKAKVGLLVTALLEDRWNKTGHMRPKAQEVTDHLAGVVGRYADVVNPGFVENEDDAHRAARLFNAEDVGLIVFVEIAYQKGMIPLRTLLNTHAPILVWNTQMIDEFPDGADFDLIMFNSGMAGLSEVTGALTRCGRRFLMVTGYLEDPQMLGELESVILASKARQNLLNSRIGIIGHPYEGMADHMVDQLSLRNKIGPVVWPIEHDEVAHMASQVSGDALKDLVARETQRYGKVDGTPGEVEYSFRTAIALEEAVRQFDVDALGLLEQIWLEDERIGVIPSYGNSRLTELGVPCTCEADVIQATSMLMLQNLAGHVTFLENYTMDFRKNTMFLSHEGVGNPILADDAKNVELIPSIYYTGVNGCGLSFKFAYKPGDFTIASLIPLSGDDWRLVVSEGEAVPIVALDITSPQMMFRNSSWTVG